MELVHEFTFNARLAPAVAVGEGPFGQPPHPRGAGRRGDAASGSTARSGPAARTGSWSAPTAGAGSTCG